MHPGSNRILASDLNLPQQVDQAFQLAIGIPLVVAVAAIAFLARPPPRGAEAQEQGIFEDDRTGAVFQPAEGTGASPERDSKGELAFRPVSYTPWPVEEGAPGDRVRVEVGPTGRTSPRTFVFDRLCSKPSRRAGSRRVDLVQIYYWNYQLEFKFNHSDVLQVLLPTNMR